MTSADPRYETVDVPVAGGLLHVGRWGTGDDVVFAAHGITANHISFRRLARELGDAVTLIAPDLRGRGRSGALPGPYGITAHVADAVAVLDHFAVDSVVALGHSMGGWVTSLLAAEHPARVRRHIVVDGAVGLALAAEVPVEQVLQAVLGPSMGRLAMTFESSAAYREFWNQHPAVGGAYWSDDIEAYVDHDLIGDPPAMRSSVSTDAVVGDATEQLTVPTIRDAIERVAAPTVFLRAPRGLLDGDPLYTPELLASLRPKWSAVTDIVDVDDTNHFTIVIGDGAPVVAAHVRAALAAP